MAEEEKILTEPALHEEQKEEKGEESEGKISSSEEKNPEPQGEGKESKEKEIESEKLPQEEKEPEKIHSDREEKGEELEKEKEKEKEEINPDSVTVTVAAASPYADAVAGVKAEFSMPQLQELEQQTLIYRYMAAAVPVPTHLVFPIWKSVTTSSASSASPEKYPTLMGLATLCLDFGKSPEPEPGRCRRTDGKKWRCWRNVVPDQKYCERHLHRGRKRPIQAIDISEDDPSTNSPATTSAEKSAIVVHGGKTEGNSSENDIKGNKDSAEAQLSISAPAAAVESS